MNKKINLAVLFFGAFFPVILRVVFPNVYHGGDLSTYLEWASQTTSLKEIYNTNCYCTYPFVGLLASVGLLKLVHANVFIFLLLLSFIDCINVFLIYFILTKLNIRYVGIWGGIIGSLPSTWAGGALWGQVDAFSQFLILSSLLTIIFYNNQKIRTKHFTLYICVIGIEFSLLLMTKPQLLFSIIPLSFLMLLNIYLHGKIDVKCILKYVFLLFFFSIIPVLIIDRWLTLPSYIHISHLERFLAKSGDVMNVLSDNGFNIWILLNRDAHSCSYIPIMPHLTPYRGGFILFLITFFVLTLVLFKQTKRHMQSHLSKELIVLYIFYLSLINLSFNLFLTGTHERYLVHFYPYLFIVLLATNSQRTTRRATMILSFSICGSILYGLFVLSILLQHPIFGFNILLLVFHLALFLFLFKEFCLGIVKEDLHRFLS